MSAHRRTDAEAFDEHVRRALRPRVEAAPMPAGVIDIPRRWTPGRDQTLTLGVRALAGAMGVAALVAAVAIGIPYLGGLLPVSVGAGTAAAVVGVPAEQVVETRDGAVAFEVVADPEPRMNVWLVTRIDDRLSPELLFTIDVPDAFLDDRSATTWMDWVSCSAERGLEHPNVLVGGANPAPQYVDVSAASESALHDRFFVVVLDASDLDAGVGVSLGEGASANTPTSAFDRADACTGEEIGPHTPIPETPEPTPTPGAARDVPRDLNAWAVAAKDMVWAHGAQGEPPALELVRIESCDEFVIVFFQNDPEASAPWTEALLWAAGPPAEPPEGADGGWVDSHEDPALEQYRDDHGPCEVTTGR
jgi:hypothetical protein